VVEPASLSIESWSQQDYMALWEAFIERHARLVIFMPGWQFSAGCAMEFAHAIEHGISTNTLDGKDITVAEALSTLAHARDEVGGDQGISSLAKLAGSITYAIERIVRVRR